MSATPTSGRARYEALLVELHREMRTGNGEGARANELRNAMTDVWYSLSEEDQAVCDELSEDLYVIEGKRTTVPLSAGETEDSVRRDLAEAFKAAENRRALACIRKLPSIDDRVIYAMSRCWEREGFYRAAVCFYDLAHDLKPNDMYEVMALEALVRSGALDETVARVQVIEERKPVSGTLLLKAASVLYGTANRVEASLKQAIYRRVTLMVEAAWDDPTALPSLRATGLVVAGFTYEHLGDNGRAIRCFDLAVAVHRSEGPLLARGLALLHVDRSRALRDFTEAANLGTKLAWPYLYAALHAMEVRRFEEVPRFCEAGIALAERAESRRRTEQAELRGRLFEWWAIAAVALGHPPGVANGLFEQAIAELPFDLVLRRNVHRYRESLGHQRAVPSDAWELPALELDENEARVSLVA